MIPVLFVEFNSNLSDSELRESAYQIFIGACQNLPPVSYVTDRTATDSKVKRSLGIYSLATPNGNRRLTIGEKMRFQMQIFEQFDSTVINYGQQSKFSDFQTRHEFNEWQTRNLNLRLYQVLIEAIFDINNPTMIIDEVEEMLEFIKQTWVILRLDQKFHNLCFLWVLFNRFVSTGQLENNLLFACVKL